MNSEILKAFLILLLIFGVIWGAFFLDKITLRDASIISISTIVSGIVGEYVARKFSKK